MRLTQMEAVDPPSDIFVHRYHVECVELTFKAGTFEPFYGSLALYDVARKKCISEMFYFDLNSETLLQLLGLWVGSSPILCSPHASSPRMIEPRCALGPTPT